MRAQGVLRSRMPRGDARARALVIRRRFVLSMRTRYALVRTDRFFFDLLDAGRLSR